MAGPDSGAPARELGETAAKSRLQRPLPPWLNLEAQGLAKLVGTADVKDKGTSGAVSKNRMHAAHEQTLEPSSTSDQDQEHNQRECKNQICSPQSCSNRSNPFGAVRERERAERRERRRESTRCGTFSCSLQSCECLDTRLSSAEGVSGTNRQTSCQREPDMVMPPSVLPDGESVACTTPVEANMLTPSGQPRGATMIARSGSDSESHSEAVASAEAEVAGRCGFGTDAVECAGGGGAGRAEVCSGVQGSEPECEILNRKKKPTKPH